MIYKINKNCTIDETGDESIIFDPEMKNVYILRPLEREIWKLFDGKNNIDQIVQTMVGHYSNDDNCLTIKQDTLDYIDTLIAFELVEPIGS